MSVPFFLFQSVTVGIHIYSLIAIWFTKDVYNMQLSNEPAEELAELLVKTSKGAFDTVGFAAGGKILSLSLLIARPPFFCTDKKLISVSDRLLCNLFSLSCQKKFASLLPP
jgi:hypothetical protein